jgi:hypothetical protein
MRRGSGQEDYLPGPRRPGVSPPTWGPTSLALRVRMAGAFLKGAGKTMRHWGADGEAGWWN